MWQNSKILETQNCRGAVLWLLLASSGKTLYSRIIMELGAVQCALLIANFSANAELLILLQVIVGVILDNAHANVEVEHLCFACRSLSFGALTLWQVRGLASFFVLLQAHRVGEISLDL